MTVWIATIEHQHGTNVYVAASAKALTNEVYGSVKMWWEDSLPPNTPIPEDHAEAIRQYFEQMEAEEHYNYHGEVEVSK